MPSFRSKSVRRLDRVFPDCDVTLVVARLRSKRAMLVKISQDLGHTVYFLALIIFASAFDESSSRLDESLYVYLYIVN